MILITHHEVAQVEHYIDPGTGSLIIQTVIATAAGVVFLLRNKIAMVWDRLRGRKPVVTDIESEPDDDPDNQ